MAATNPRSRHLPCRVFHDQRIPCVVWFEDAVRFYGVPTVGFDLYILVPDIEAASRVLIQEGWNLVQQDKGKIGNATVDYPQRRLTPPSQADHEAEQLPESHTGTFHLPLPPPDKLYPRMTTTVLIPAADWNFSFAGAGANNAKALVNTIFPSLADLVDALIDSLLDCPLDNSMLQRRLSLYITSLYDHSPALEDKAFAEQLAYEHRQYHHDVLSGMDHGTIPFIIHQQNIREALRQRTHTLLECSARNEDLFTRDLQARILASMPNPFEGMEPDEEGMDPWDIATLQRKEIPHEATKRA